VWGLLAPPGTAATVGGDPAGKGLKEREGDAPAEPPVEKDKGKSGAEKGGTKPPGPEAPKKKVTTIRDALTIDPNIYGVDFSKSKLGDVNDIVTRDAMKDSARTAIDSEAMAEQEQIKEDRHATTYEESVGKTEAKAVEQARVREQERAERAERTKEQRPWLLIGAGGAVFLALVVFIIAMRKMRDYD
jgi:hypothetical protein